METLWSPWRSKYIGTFKDEEAKSKEKCFLCTAAESPLRDKELYVVARRKHCFAVLNLYPYNNGHVLVAPYRHTGDFEKLSEEESNEIMHLSKEVTSALKYIYSPHGFNFGANIGNSSGAGLPEHIHFHIVPRWNGDTSFISIVSDTKIVSVAIEETWEQLSTLLNS